MRYFKDDYTIHYTEEGKGPPVILVHGIASSLHGWDSMKLELLLAGYRVIALDLLGHGDSAKPDAVEQYNTHTVYGAFESWLERLRLDQPIVLIGHSLGGHLSLRFSLRRPQQISALILIAPFYTPRQLTPTVLWLYRRPSLGVKALSRVPEHIIHTAVGWDPLFGSRIPSKARLQIAADLKRASPHILHILHSVPDLTPELGGVHLPTQVIWGGKDLTLKPSMFPSLVSSLPAAAGHRLSGLGHQPHITQPGTVSRLILDFLSGLPLSARPRRLTGASPQGTI